MRMYFAVQCVWATRCRQENGMTLCRSADVLTVNNVSLVADFNTLSSLVRDCFATSGNPAGTSCDNSLPPTCVSYCRTNQCNDQDGDLHKGLNTDDGGGGVASLSRGSLLLIVCSWVITSVAM